MIDEDDEDDDLDEDEDGDEDDDDDSDEDEDGDDERDEGEVEQGDLLDDINDALTALDLYVESEVKKSDGIIEVELDDNSRWQLRLTRLP